MDKTTAEAERRALIYRQTKSLMLAVPKCPDGSPDLACVSCLAEAMADVIVTFVETGDLAR